MYKEISIKQLRFDESTLRISFHQFLIKLVDDQLAEMSIAV